VLWARTSCRNACKCIRPARKHPLFRHHIIPSHTPYPIQTVSPTISRHNKHLIFANKCRVALQTLFSRIAGLHGRVGGTYFMCYVLYGSTSGSRSCTVVMYVGLCMDTCREDCIYAEWKHRKASHWYVCGWCYWPCGRADSVRTVYRLCNVCMWVGSARKYFLVWSGHCLRVVCLCLCIHKCIA
jgi:hypothetical protein